MKFAIQHEPLLVERLDTVHGPTPIHSRSHYKLMLIQEGRGEFAVNGNRFMYQANDVLFLSPTDTYSFTISQRTCAYTLSFTPPYLASLATDPHVWPHINDYNTPLPGTIVTNQTEQRSLLALVEIIWLEQQRLCPLLANPIVESLMKTILSLLDRQLAQHSSGSTLRPVPSSTLIQRVVVYICQHITEPDALRMDRMADAFNYSASHLCALFKQQAGESIQQYIIRHKLKLVETRLIFSSLTISQIADEFGFSDVCHLNKLFKRYYRHTPTNYRRRIVLS
ncbi:AraC family transcriptional regulator [soil metagenome]